MNEPLSLRLANSFDALHPVESTVTTWLETRHASPAAIYLANLAIEELVTNCIKHGYDDTFPHVIDIFLSLEAGEMKLEVVDDGHVFNPLDAPPPDLTLPIEDRPLGGLGIHMLRKMSDRMEYKRLDGHNRVTLYKRAG